MILRDLGRSAVVIIFTMIYQYFMIQIIAPDTQLYEIAESATKVNGAQHAEMWFTIAVVYFPLVMYAVAFLTPIGRSFWRNLVTQ